MRSERSRSVLYFSYLHALACRTERFTVALSGNRAKWKGFWVYLQAIYRSYLQTVHATNAIYACITSAAAAVCKARAQYSVLDRGTTESVGIYRCRCARGVVTSRAMTVSVDWPEVCGGPHAARWLDGAVVRLHVEVRGFWSVVVLFVRAITYTFRKP